MTMKNELTLVRPDLLVDSRIIAARLENQHRNVLTLIETHLEHFEGFGRVAFETQTLETAGGPQKTRYALLNEDQCYFLLSLSRNSETVVALKASLVYSFKKAREAANPALDISDPLVLAQQFIQAETERRALAADNGALKQVLEVAAPKAGSYDRYLSTEGLHDLDEAARLIGWGLDQMLEELRRRKVLMVGENNQPYQRFLEYGYFKVKARVVVILGLDRVTAATLVTPGGVAFLNRIIGKYGVADTSRPSRTRHRGQRSGRLTALSVSQEWSRQRE